MKKLLPFLMAMAMLPAVAFGASDDTSGADAAVTDVPGDSGTMEGPPESVEEEEGGQAHGQSSTSGSADMDITTESEEGGGTTEGEARETPFDEEDQSTGQGGMSGSDNTNGATGMEPGDDDDAGGTMEGTPESVEEEEEIN